MELEEEKCQCPGCKQEAASTQGLCPFCNEAPFHIHCEKCGHIVLFPEALAKPKKCNICGADLIQDLKYL